ncbi:hypothetical protein OSTOST_22413, partial [Ostertagia ostertagi]
VHGHAKWKVDHLSVTRPEQTSYKFELNGLEPSTKYHFRLSASSTKGEGQRSVEHVVMTDVPVPAAPEISSLTFDCKNGILLQWNSNEGQSCEVEITNETSTLRFNTSASKLDVIDLALHDEYKVRVMCMVRSIVDSRVTLKGPWGNEQRFVLSHQCSYQSSVCSPNSKCMRLRDSTSPPRFSLLVAISALVLFVVLCFLIIYSLKGPLSRYKNAHQEEGKVRLPRGAQPSYSTTCDDIPVELFYGYCEDLARNDNAKYTSQFQ